MDGNLENLELKILTEIRNTIFKKYVLNVIVSKLIRERGKI